MLIPVVNQCFCVHSRCVKISRMRKNIVAIHCLLLTLSTTAAADIYVYRHKDGSVLITEFNQSANPNYTLMDIKRTDNSSDGLPRINVHNAKSVGKPKRISRSPYDSSINAIALRYGIDDNLIKAIVKVESAFKAGAVSPKGAQGLMQLMPGTAERYGVADSFDPIQNLLGGVRYLKDLLSMFNNNLTLALAAYNAGENAVQKYNGIPPYRETRQYVQKVIHYHRLYASSNT